ncbi:carboxylesterase 5A [Alligator mississippiensis]|uniref:Carboxylic ester hydrolase n=1 Tax=Alligator mississippiensis TaxID=8496 RepID=A0A151N730_ALLMI|nr:carboxylesterase 5A [Alligator mississippiensis]
MWLHGALLCAAGLAAASGQKSGQPEVVTKYGRLLGKQISVAGADRLVNVFLGIPFAKPPVGPLRFSPPQPPEPWSKLRNSTSFPPMCLQDLAWIETLKILQKFENPTTEISEDCLYLDVYTPASSNKEAKLPVMVWIHGGGFTLGGASAYDGSALTAYENVVVVIIQYRLGILGFLSTGDEYIRGNWGLLDQVAALQWVKENIDTFGGDPESVTLFGESAGGISVGANILSPMSKGLFHKAISQSGVVNLPGSTISKPQALTRVIANLAGCEMTSSAIVNCLRKKTEKEIVSVTTEALKQIAYFPAVVDGVFFPKEVDELLADKEFSTVPYMVGVNNHEYGWIIPNLFKFRFLQERMHREDIISELHKIASQLMLPVEFLSLVTDEYLGDTNDPDELRAQFQEMMGDFLFVFPAIQVSRYHRDSGASVYFYEFQHRPSIFKDTKPHFVKADHGDEIGFVFGNLFISGNSVLVGDGTEEEKQLSRKMMKYWANFARNGNPNGNDLVEWPVFDLKEQYLELNLKQGKGQKLKEKRIEFWTKSLAEKLKTIKDKEKRTEL